MKFILKILLAPVMLILAFLIWLCTLTLHAVTPCSGTIRRTPPIAAVQKG